jgi:hypothetical protein
MKKILLFSILFIFGLDQQSIAGLLNVATNKPVSINYQGTIPSDTSKTNPNKVVDGSTSTWLVINPQNTGTSLVIDLMDSYDVRRINIRQPFDQTNTNTRIRAYQVYFSLDGSLWSKVIDDLNQTKPNIDTMFTSLFSARFVKFVVTKTEGSYQTLIAEIEVYAEITFPAIIGISFSDVDSSGVMKKAIRWSSMNMISSDRVNIYYKRVTSTGDYEILSSNELNDSVYLWDVRKVASDTFLVKISPVTSGRSLSATGRILIMNFKLLVLNISNPRELAYRQSSDSYYIMRTNFVPLPAFYSSIFKDTIRISWNFNSLYIGSFQYDLLYTTDAGVHWTKIVSITDTSKKSYNWIVPDQINSMNTYFKVSIISEGKDVGSIQTTYPIAVSSLPGNLSVKWLKTEKGYPYNTEGAFTTQTTAQSQFWMPSLLSFPNPDNPSNDLLVIGSQLMMYGSGDTIQGRNHQGSSANGYAAADCNGDGRMELVTDYGGQLYSIPIDSMKDHYYESNSGGILTSNKDGFILSDLNSDGKYESIIYRNSIVYIYSNSGILIEKIVLPSYITASCFLAGVADIDGDGYKEIVVPNLNTIYVYNSRGQNVAGFPVVLNDILRPWALCADFDNSGTMDIVVAGVSHLYCITSRGILRSGFPIFIDNDQFTPSVRPGAIADMNNDGYLDIILLTEKSSYSGSDVSAGKQPVTKIYVIDRFGRIIPQWPVTINDNYLSKVRFSDVRVGLVDTLVTNSIQDFAVTGAFCQPLVASIDGDKDNEIILTNSNGFMYVLNADGTMRDGYPVYLGTYGEETGVLGDFDHDGSLNFVCHSFPERNGTARILCLDFGANSYNPHKIPWPMYMHDAARSGIASTPVILGPGNTALKPNVYYSFQNFPNPFNPSTKISFFLPKSGRTKVTIFNTLGQQVESLLDGYSDEGYHEINFNARNLSSGVYFYTVESGSFRDIKKMNFVK